MHIAGATRYFVSREEVMFVSVKERILTIRLMEKMNAQKAYANAFSIVAPNGIVDSKRQPALESANKQS